jgi:outer membrane protein assembly factor BamB/adenine/guanine phosphoribosyltransferase-like PRPP-binding protein
MTSPQEESRERLKRVIENAAFVRSRDIAIVSRGGTTHAQWLFDMRAILMRSDVMNDISLLFWEAFKNQGPIQIGCIESAGIPLMTALVAHAQIHGVQKCNGFFIRKSRKKDGLVKMIEGRIEENVKIVLVDDLINSGRSFVRQVEVLEGVGKKVDTIWMLLRFRDSEFYEYFRKKGIRIRSIFELNDFTDTLDVKNLVVDAKKTLTQDFTVVWKFSSPNPSYFHVVPKSELLLHGDRIYMGSDNGTMWCLNQNDGSVAWSYKVGFHRKSKGISSSPALFENTLYFGAYDGNVYALDSQSGKKRWIFFEADWVGSSPAIAQDLGMVFIGLEFGLWRKRGGIVALDAKNGKKIWQYEMPCFTHSSPIYIKEHRQVVIGSNESAVYMFDAKTGVLQWKFETGSLSDAELNSGFSAYDIKASFAHDKKRDLIIFANMRGEIFFVERKTGHARGSFKAEFGSYSTPVIWHDTVFCTSLDKNLYCIDLDTFQKKWSWDAGARIFATPTSIDDSIYIGSNTGRLTELDPETGAEKSFLTLTERITNKVAYNPQTKRFFIPTFANEIYCVEKIK